MLEHDDRVLAGERGVHQAHVVVRRGRRDDPPARVGREDAGRVHRVLRPVAGAHRHLAAQHQRHTGLTAVHVPRLADLVEQLVGGDPHEVGVHELDDRRAPPVERDAAGQPGEGVLADRGAEDPAGEPLRESAGGAVRPAVEPVHVLAHDDDAGVGLHPAAHDGGDGLDELGLLHRYGEAARLDDPRGAELREVAAHAHVDPVRVGPLRGPDPPLAGLAAGQRLDQLAADLLHRGLGASERLGGLVGGHDAAALEVRGGLGERVPRPPGALLLLVPVAEGAACERAVLVEEPVGVDLDHGRAAAAAHVLDGLGHREVDRERVHPVDLPAGDVEAQAARGEPGLGGRLVDGGGDGVLVVLDEEADRQGPGRGEVHRLERGADVDRPVAEVGHRHGVGAGLAVRPGEARGLGYAAADDGVGAHGAGVLPLQVHRTAAPVAPAAVEAADLGEGAQQHVAHRLGGRLERVEALGLDVVQRLGEELVVAPVRAVDGVLAGEREHRADRAALLADAGVGRAVDESAAGEVEDVLLEGPDPDQLGVDRAQQVRVGGVPVGLGGDDLHPRGGGGEGAVLGHGSPWRFRCSAPR